MGAKVPEVTQPNTVADVASAKMEAPSRTGLASPLNPTRLRAAPCDSCDRMISAPGKPAAARAALASCRPDGPVERRLDRRCLLRQIVAVQAQTGFQPQTVPRAEPDQLHRRVIQEPLGQGSGHRGRNRDFKAILARIAGAGDEAGLAADGKYVRVHEAHGGDHRHHGRQRRASSGSLNRQQCALRQGLDAALIGQMLPKVQGIGRGAGGIHHEVEMRAQVRDHQVVADAACLGREEAVALAARSQRRKVHGHQRLERQGGIANFPGARAQDDLAHVRDVEESGGVAGVAVFAQDAEFIVNGHRPAGEWFHSRAAGEVKIMQWQLPQGRKRHGGTGIHDGDSFGSQRPPAK